MNQKLIMLSFQIPHRFPSEMTQLESEPIPNSISEYKDFCEPPQALTIITTL